MFKAWWNIYTSLCCKFTTESVSEKKCGNRLIFGEVIGKSLVSCFLTHSVVQQQFLQYVQLTALLPKGCNALTLPKLSLQIPKFNPTYKNVRISNCLN